MLAILNLETTTEREKTEFTYLETGFPYAGLASLELAM